MAQELHQARRDFLARVHVHSRGLGCGDEQIIAAHEGRALHPADARMSEGDALGPAALIRPLRADRVKGGLRLRVGAVPAEDSTVRRARQEDVETMIDRSRSVEGREFRDRALDRPQEESLLGHRPMRV